MTNFDLPKRLMMVGDFESAIEELEKIIQEDPDNIEAWFYLTDAHEEKKEKIRCLRQILIIAPDNERAKNELDHLEKQQAVSYEALLDSMREPEDRGDEGEQSPVFEMVDDAPATLSLEPDSASKNKIVEFLENDKIFIFIVGALVVLIAVTLIGIF